MHRTSVEVGELLSDGLEIVDGVKPGDLVVTAGVSRVYDGLQVRVPERAGSEPGNVAGEPAPAAEPALTTEADETP